MASPNVKLSIDRRPAAQLTVLAGFAGVDPDAGRLAEALAAALKRLGENSGWRGLAGQIARATSGGAKPKLIEVQGLGKRTDFDAASLQRWLRSACDRADREGTRELSLVLPDIEITRGRAALPVLLGLLASGYRFDRFKRPEQRTRLRTVYLVPPVGEDDNYKRALPLAKRITTGTRLAKDLGNTPPNEATPAWMADQAARLASRHGLACEVLDRQALVDRGMGGILAVGSGSSNPPFLVRLEWGDGDHPVAFVGKGVTFDTGGISIKPSADMDEMKYDKCGACTVLGVVRAVVESNLPGRYRAYLPLAENMPDGASYRPSDIVRCYSGKTVEIINTDAEGRMILADALAWAAEEKPETLIELSTLTGSTVVALGNEAAALYTPSDDLADELLEAGNHSGERLWRMPLWPGFANAMKGNHADLKNTGSRWGGANQAAAFLASFVGRTRRWAHLDIAGTAYVGSGDKGDPGATGFGVGLLLDWLLRRTEHF